MYKNYCHIQKDVTPDIGSRIDLSNYRNIRTLTKPFTVDELLVSVSELLKDVVELQKRGQDVCNEKNATLNIVI